MISFKVEDDTQAILDMVGRLAADRLRPGLRAFEEARDCAADLRREVHGLGLTTLTVPEAAGGQGLDMRTAAMVAEGLSAGDPGAALALGGPGLAAEALATVGTDEQRARLLAPFGRSDGWDLRGAVAWVEGARGVDPDEIRTTVRPAESGGGFVLDGRKRYVLDGDRASLFVVVARDPDCAGWDGIRVVAVEGRDGVVASEPSVTCGLMTARFADVAFSEVRVPDSNVLAWGDVAREGLARFLARHRTLLAARLVGTAHAASHYAFKYATERSAFGVRLREHQALAFMAADMATATDAARWMAWRAAWAVDTGRDDATTLAAQALAGATARADRVTTDAVQILGGHGYIQDHPVEKWMRDARTLGLAFGFDRFLAHELVPASVEVQP